MATYKEAATRLLDEKNVEIARLRAAIEEAPHNDDCAGWERLHSTDGTDLYFNHLDPIKCDCWKREALDD